MKFFGIFDWNFAFIMQRSHGFFLVIVKYKFLWSHYYIQQHLKPGASAIMDKPLWTKMNKIQTLNQNNLGSPGYHINFFICLDCLLAYTSNKAKKVVWYPGLLDLWARKNLTNLKFLFFWAMVFSEAESCTWIFSHFLQKLYPYFH